jgi:cobyrinic acid a,c-diamide synthase
MVITGDTTSDRAAHAVSAACPAAASTMTLPRVVIAAPASGHGKTTVASGLMGALRAEGLEVAGFKVGPDYIDPGYHTLATGRAGRNLDPHLCSVDQLVPLLMHGALTPTPADIAVVEGVMGLFDGQIGGEGFASTAHVAGLIRSPVILVLDISQVSRTAAAIVHGLNTFDPDVQLAGVILNKAGSQRHAAEICSAMESTGIEVLGILPRDAGVEAPSRHLGLVPAAEREGAAASLARLAANVGRHVSLTRVLAIAHSASAVTGVPWVPERVVTAASTARPVIALAGGRAFTFRYAETEELLRAAGCEPVVFDPLSDTQLPAETAGIYLGGGFPEVHATELSANTALRTELARAINAGVPTVAECAGLLYLCATVDGSPMVGAVPASAKMTSRLTLRYRTAIADGDHLLAEAGTRVTGHDFHRTTVEPSVGERSAWLLDGEPAGFSVDPAGLGRSTVHASYLHVHWAGHPQLAQRFCDAAHAAVARRPDGLVGRHQGRVGHPGGHFDLEDGLIDLAVNARRSAPVPEHDLHHHGDAELEDGLIDLAVNVRLAAPPRWLMDVIEATTLTLGSYPRTEAAITAIAQAHNRSEDQVLPTSGGAEAFTLLARAIQPAAPLIVHPQFTEPEAALIAAGCRPRRLILLAEQGFTLDPALVPADADLVMIGNPTNPTSVLHPAESLLRLRRPGRVVCVDEAFMDAVPGELESLAESPREGLVIVRSLTKTWGLAGLRAGYAVGDPHIIAAMRRQQPPWSVSTPALAAITACLLPEARAVAALTADGTDLLRALLIRELAGLGLAVAGKPAAPFVLVDTSPWSNPANAPGWVRDRLRALGFAVRRGETFPGLDADWIRIAVRDEPRIRAFIAALTSMGEVRSTPLAEMEDA